ncbi:DEAD/DEAH box helicase [Ferruginibacter yonginensis]|uniref:DEAD/DEAH box helicase n=1 Tax=Ferruginibacter yonginensis TaxID=1310416 RepID=A0ABV8QPW7_9BACT
MLFTDLNLNNALRNALQDMGFKQPTPIQHRAFATAMSGVDVCGIAQTGTGKTVAYLLPILRQWQFTKDNHPQILIIVPTRELVTQVVATIEQLTAYMTVVTVGVYGGVNINTQKLAVEKKVDILVATPGRLFDLTMNGSLKLKNIKKLVIDEVDELLNLGFRKQLQNILELLPTKRQTLLFSATITDDVATLINEYFKAPVKIEAAPTGTPLENIEQIIYEVPNFYSKVNLLKLLLQQDVTMNKVLVFAGSRAMADQLSDELLPNFEGQYGVIHANKEQNHRFNTVQQFKEGVYKFIIATDIVARGIDIAEVSHVINFDMPNEPENYMHRIGRTGRADKNGIAITFITPKEITYKENVEALMNKTIAVEPLPENLVLSTELTEDEKPKVFVKEIQIKIPKRDDVGPAFHPKSAKNSKVNVVISRKDRMMKKYGKPKTRGQKRK